MKFKILIFALVAILPLSAQKKVSPDNLYNFGPITVQKPVLLDSVNLKESKFSNDMLLAYSVNFPDQSRFTNGLKKDTAGFFHLAKPEKGFEFQLLSFYVSGDRYGKGKITVTSPNPLELWVDDSRRATKTELNDSLHQAGSVSTNLNGFTVTNGKYCSTRT